MRYILLALLMFLASESREQIKVSTNIDHFTGDTSFETQEYPLIVYHHSKKDSSIAYTVKAYLSNTGGKKNYSLAIMFDNFETMSLDEGYHALFKLANNETISADYIGGYKIYGENDNVFYHVDVTNIMGKIKDVDITNIRLNTSKINIDLELTDYKHLISQLLQALPNP